MKAIDVYALTDDDILALDHILTTRTSDKVLLRRGCAIAAEMHRVAEHIRRQRES